MKRRALGVIGLLGGLGGMINAALCYACLPVAAGGTGSTDFKNLSWLIIPAGAMHGAVLAAIPVRLAVLFFERRGVVRWLGLPLAGWLSGGLSFAPIQLAIFLPSLREVNATNVMKVLIYPLATFLSPWASFVYFGAVGFLYYFFLSVCRWIAVKRLVAHVFMGCVSAWLGSHLVWRIFQPWYFSLIHGAIWGSLVGVGVWTSQTGRLRGGEVDATRG